MIKQIFVILLCSLTLFFIRLENSRTDVIYIVDISFSVYDALMNQPASAKLKNEKPNNIKLFEISETKWSESAQYYMHLSCFDEN